MAKLNEKRIFLTLEKVNADEVKLELNFTRDDEKYEYIIGIASTPDVNSCGFITENEALLNSWAECKKNGKQIAVYEKHGLPVGKIADCQEMSGKILVVLEIPKSGNERVLAVYEQDVYTGLSIGGWTIDGYYDDNDTYHVTEFEWYEVSLTDIPANENALLLEQINENRIKEKAKTTKLEDKKISDEELKIALENITKSIRGIN